MWERYDVSFKIILFSLFIHSFLRLSICISIRLIYEHLLVHNIPFMVLCFCVIVEMQFYTINIYHNILQFDRLKEDCFFIELLFLGNVHKCINISSVQWSLVWQCIIDNVLHYIIMYAYIVYIIFWFT